MLHAIAMDAASDLGEYPQLRALRAEEATASGRRGIALFDPLGLAEPAFVPRPLVPALLRCDGATPLPAIARAAHLDLADLCTVLTELDRRLLLHGPRYAAARDRMLATWLQGGIRHASHAGSPGYPAHEDQLRRALEAIVPAGTGPRMPVRGLIAPHIDLQRGQAGYAAAYGRLLAAPPADLYVVFGTGHQGPGAPLTGLPLDFATPLGLARTDRAFVAAVHDAIGEPAAEDLLLHRDEHSIEFQVLLLQHVAERRGDPPPRIAPFLCGALPSSTGDPTAESWFADVLLAFRAAIAACGGEVCIVAGADLAHLGPFFGDRDPVDAAALHRLASDELARLRHLEAGQPGAFFAAVEAGGNPDRVCSAPAITWTAALATGRLELLHYGQAADPDGSQVVSFCAGVL